MIFDVGHGMGCLSFDTASAMIEQGFFLDVISSDVHALCIDGPAYNLLTTLSKFLFLGIPLPDLVARTTVKAAQAVRRPELGVLKVGGIGDATILAIEEGRFTFVDSVGKEMTGKQRLVCKGCVLGGSFMPVTPKGSER